MRRFLTKLEIEKTESIARSGEALAAGDGWYEFVWVEIGWNKLAQVGVDLNGFVQVYK